MIWEAVWRKAPFPFSSLNVRIFKLQSLSTGVLRSTISPSISPAVAALASPSLISAAISMTDFASAYSFTEPSFKVIFMVSFLLLIFHFYPCFPVAGQLDQSEQAYFYFPFLNLEGLEHFVRRRNTAKR